MVNVALWAGLKKTKNTAACNLYWGKHLSPEQYEMLTRYHKVNHFPGRIPDNTIFVDKRQGGSDIWIVYVGTWSLGRKDILATRLLLMRQKFSTKEFAFVPQTFVLPRERKLLEAEMESRPSALWIQKPYSSSCGKGIRLINRAGQLGAKSKCVVSR